MKSPARDGDSEGGRRLGRRGRVARIRAPACQAASLGRRPCHAGDRYGATPTRPGRATRRALDSAPWTTTGQGDSGPRRDAARPARCVIARPFGVPVDVTPAWFLVAALITVGVRRRRSSGAVPGLGRLAVRRLAAFAVLLYALRPASTSSATRVVALRLRPRRCAGSACTCSAACPRSSDRRTPRAGRQASRSPGRLVSLARRGAWPSCVAELLDPGTVGRLLARALMLSNLLVGAFNLLPGPAPGRRPVLSAAVWRATGRRHTRHGRGRLGRPGRRRARPGQLPFLLAPRAPGPVRHCVDVALGRAARRLHLGRRQPGASSRAACSSGCPASPPGR